MYPGIEAISPGGIDLSPSGSEGKTALSHSPLFCPVPVPADACVCPVALDVDRRQPSRLESGSQFPEDILVWVVVGCGKAKSLVLFLASTGARVGEALCLKAEDLKLDEDVLQDGEAPDGEPVMHAISILSWESSFVWGKGLIHRFRYRTGRFVSPRVARGISAQIRPPTNLGAHPQTPE